MYFSCSRSRRPPGRGGEPTEEEKRRLIRRQRNKEAAARCRKRRVDQTSTLEDEVSQWEDRNNSSRREIEALEAQKRHLLSLLEGHRAEECQIGGKSSKKL
jgi:fos-like antigen